MHACFHCKYGQLEMVVAHQQQTIMIMMMAACQWGVYPESKRHHHTGAESLTNQANLQHPHVDAPSDILIQCGCCCIG